MAISEISPVQNSSLAFKVSVQKLSSTAPCDTAEVILALAESGLPSPLKSGENSGQELRHSPVVPDLKVIGVLRKNGEEGFVAEPAVKLDAKWNLRAVVFVQEKKNRRILGAAAVRLAP